MHPLEEEERVKMKSNNKKESEKQEEMIEDLEKKMDKMKKLLKEVLEEEERVNYLDDTYYVRNTENNRSMRE